MASANGAKPDLSPARWPDGEVERYTVLNRTRDPRPLAEGRKGMVAGTTGALAVRSGLEALKQGGSAVDAVMTTALAQISLAAGAWVSYAGIMTMVCYEAKTGQVHSMNAGYNTFLEEKDPMTIPPINAAGGRTAMVPGFMAGVQAAHDRFGKLPFETLFQPAIHFAETGFAIDAMMAPMFEVRKGVIARLPEIQSTLAKPDGQVYREGDWFRQPKVAHTLRQISAQGSAYMYTGEWASKFVDAVRAEGGKATMADMERYRVLWNAPLHTGYHGYELYQPGFPSFGGVSELEAFNMVEAADILRHGHPNQNPEALYWLIQISRAFHYMQAGVSPALLRKYLPGVDVSPAGRAKKETSRRLWELIRDKGWAPLLAEARAAMSGPQHSDAVVAVDEQGNVASIVHTINCVTWGTTGIFVDGISIPDSACFQQPLLAAVGPGARLPDPTTPGLATRDGKPVLAFSSIGSGLHERTLQAVINILDFGMDPKTALDTPSFLAPVLNFGQPDMMAEYDKQAVAVGEYPAEILDAVRALGQPMKEVPEEQKRFAIGYVVAARIDSDGRIEGSSSPLLNGAATGH